MCDLNTLLNPAHTDAYTQGLFFASNRGFMCPVNFLFLLVSHGHPALPKEHSLDWRSQFLSVYVSYFTVVVLYLFLYIFVYMRLASTLPIDKAVAVFYTIVDPTLNTLFCSLGKYQKKTAMRKFCSEKIISNTSKCTWSSTLIQVS